jgi:hypothetical protein
VTAGAASCARAVAIAITGMVNIVTSTRAHRVLPDAIGLVDSGIVDCCPLRAGIGAGVPGSPRIATIRLERRAIRGNTSGRLVSLTRCKRLRDFEGGTA